MATIVVMPQLGNSVETCLITAWEVSVGDAVEVNQVLCSIETDKASMDVPSTEAGTVLKLLFQEGDEVPVKEPIAVIGEALEQVDDAALGLATPAEPEPRASEGADQPAPASAPAQPDDASATPMGAPQAADRGEPATGSSPRARALAASKHIDVSSIAEGTGPHGRVIERDVVAALANAPTGTGLGGRETAADREAAASSTTPTPTAGASVASGEFPGAYTDTPLKGIRKIVAERMMNSLATSAQLTYTSTANAAGLLALRAKLKNSDASLGVTGITIGDLVGFAVVRTLLKHPHHNAHLCDGVLRTFESVHLGFAADTPRGLLVPTIRNADAMSLKRFSVASKELATDAIEQKINPDLLSGATFTVSNLGSFGIESFTPLINRPQTAILGVDAIVGRATLNPDGKVGVEQRIGFSLTADHQVIDGADAARFLRDLVTAVENIDVTVLG